MREIVWTNQRATATDGEDGYDQRKLAGENVFLLHCVSGPGTAPHVALGRRF